MSYIYTHAAILVQVDFLINLNVMISRRTDAIAVGVRGHFALSSTVRWCLIFDAKMTRHSRSLALVLVGLSLVAAFSPVFRGESRFFLDTAVVSEWSALLPLGIFHGVTTNPALLERAGHACTIDSIHKLASIALQGTDEFMCQSWGSSADESYRIGMALSEPARDRIVIKVPVTATGVEAASRLIKSGVRTCLTACYNRKQALVAAGVGAEYIAPYLGRMNDNGLDGTNECLAMQDIIDGLQSETRILVASLRDAAIMADLAASGMDTFTFGPETARMLFEEPLTEQAAADFEEAAVRGSS